MICFEVQRNGNRLCVAGVPEGILTGLLTWGSHRLGEEPPWDLELRVGGRTGGKHVDWVFEYLGLGEEILFRIVEAPDADPPDADPPVDKKRPTDPEEARRIDLAVSRKLYVELKRRIRELEDRWGEALEDTEGNA
jgi:hypothetical protein